MNQEKINSINEFLNEFSKSYEKDLKSAIQLGLDKIGVKVKDEAHLFEIAKKDITVSNFSHLSKDVYTYKGKKILQVNFCTQYEVNFPKSRALSSYEFEYFD